MAIDNYEPDEELVNPCEKCIHKWNPEKCRICRHNPVKGIRYKRKR